MSRTKEELDEQGEFEDSEEEKQRSDAERRLQEEHEHIYEQ